LVGERQNVYAALLVAMEGSGSYLTPRNLEIGDSGKKGYRSFLRFMRSYERSQYHCLSLY
jgi:hypothetical protein